MAPTNGKDNDPVLLIVGELRGRMGAVEEYVKSIDSDVKTLSSNVGALRESINTLAPGMSEIMKWKMQQTKREQSRRDKINRALGWLAGATLLTGSTGYAFWDRIAAIVKAAAVSMK